VAYVYSHCFYAVRREFGALPPLIISFVYLFDQTIAKQGSDQAIRELVFAAASRFATL